ncbi:TIGR01777 family oxidoreductase [Lutibacter sp.]|uniref:TIGR01777 family oxidoreductase n=1 Tax=Lutibacter sp. TaxID=1925666 RepID=UPI002732B9D4|nr:TIGR01777 family oxidoreductase [Lutibacter sp.]MDP3312275.1 TIGR01777 family oxidoreductase [Lutibacter sp.]
MATILVTGASGLIGKQLCILLKQKGHLVKVLSRNKANTNNSYYWDIDANFIDEEALLNTEFIIHLAGENIGGKQWTKSQKQHIIDSRVKSANLLYNTVKRLNINLKGFIAASGVGYYGAETTKKTYTEKDVSGSDFLSTVCLQWENVSKQFKQLGIRTVILRTGVVFSKKGGALEKIIKPIKLGFGAVLGNGNQFMPWIHINDLCKMYAQAVENENLNGIYNAVSPEFITNKQVTELLAKDLGKKIWLPNIPAFILKFALGKMSNLILEGSRISAEKIIKTGFKFKYANLKEALNNLLN